MKKWKKLRAQIKPEFKAEVSEDKTVIVLSGDVVSNDYYWYESDITPSKIQKALNDSNGDVVIKLNSGGGDAFAGVEIYNSLKDYQGKVTVEVTGLAASAASIIAMGADEIVMCTGSMMMVHEAWTWAVGNKSELMKVVSMMDKLDSSLVDIYAERIGVDKEFIKDLLQDETWMTAEEAVANGFADKVKKVISEDEIDVAAKINNTMTVKVEIPDEFYQSMNEVKEELNTVKEMMNAQEDEGSIFVAKNTKLKFMKEVK